MAKKTFHKGWLYERDGIKFAPYTLKESIVDRNGQAWTNGVDNKLSEIENALQFSSSGLQDSVNALAYRATLLETRTQYLDATSSEEFYITDRDTGYLVNWYKYTHIGRDAHINFNPEELEEFFTNFKNSEEKED